MSEVKVEAVLYDESSALKKWEEPHEPELAGIIQAVKYIQGDVNNYLTCLIAKEKGLITKDEAECFYDKKQGKMENDEDDNTQEDIKEDKIFGFTKDIMVVNEQRCRNEKRKSNFYNEVKKFKKL